MRGGPVLRSIRIKFARPLHRWCSEGAFCELEKNDVAPPEGLHAAARRASSFSPIGRPPPAALLARPPPRLLGAVPPSRRHPLAGDANTSLRVTSLQLKKHHHLAAGNRKRDTPRHKQTLCKCAADDHYYDSAAVSLELLAQEIRTLVCFTIWSEIQ